MPLDDYEPPAPMPTPTNTRAVQKQIDSDGGMQLEGAGGEMHQLQDVDRLEQYGLASEPLAETEQVIIDASPIPIAHERPERPSGLPSLTSGSGEVVLYNESTVAYIYLNTTGDIIVEPKNGRHVYLNDGATELVALDGDDCNKNADMVLWMGQVETFINGVAPGTINPLSGTFASIADVSSSANNTFAK